MTNYLEIGQRALEYFQAQKNQIEPSTVPPPEQWPESLLDLARERGRQTGDDPATREEIWISWCEWKAGEINRLFQEHGLTGQPGLIRPETIRDGMERAARGGRSADERRTPGESGEL